MKTIDIALQDIKVSNGRSPSSKSVVDQLANSIQEIGLLNPVGITTDHKLICGRDRVEAFRSLGRTTIPAVVHDLDELHAELAEIDENIHRKKLTKVDECKALARRKEIYLLLHPETKQGTAGANAKYGKKPAKENISFARDTASKTGKTARSINLDVALGSALPDEVVHIISDSPIANNKSELKQLAKLPGDIQMTVATMLANQEVDSVTEAIACNDDVKEAVRSETGRDEDSAENEADADEVEYGEADVNETEDEDDDDDSDFVKGIFYKGGPDMKKKRPTPAVGNSSTKYYQKALQKVARTKPGGATIGEIADLVEKYSDGKISSRTAYTAIAYMQYARGYSVVPCGKKMVVESHLPVECDEFLEKVRSVRAKCAEARERLVRGNSVNFDYDISVETIQFALDQFRDI